MDLNGVKVTHTFNSDGTFSTSTPAASIAFESRLDAACVAALTYQQATLAEYCAASDGQPERACSISGQACVCTGTIAIDAESTPGTYVTLDGELTMTPDVGEPTTTDYCVDGATVTLQETDPDVGVLQQTLTRR